MQEDRTWALEDKAWNQIKHHAVETTERAEKRLADLRELHAAVKDHLLLLNVREEDTISRLHGESKKLVRQIQQREEELIKMLRDDCALQRTQIEKLQESIETQKKLLETQKSQLEEHKRDVIERAEAQRQVTELLRQSAFFEVPELHCYNVTSATIVTDRHLTLVRDVASFFFPSALTIPIADNSIYLPLGRGKEKCESVVQENASMILHDGILHYIATTGGKKPFSNPVESDAVRIYCDAPVVLGELSSLCNAVDATRTTAAVLQQTQCFRTASQEGARIEIDFGDRRWVECSAYALRHGHATEHAALRSWRLLGSRDRVRWVVLDEQRRNNMLGRSPFNVASFTIDEEQVYSQVKTTRHSASALGCAFRYIALELAGPDAVGKYHLELGGMELYGYLVNTLSL
ncbi:putative E3 ubiquitin-protein ligase HECTD1-like isoform X6 [Trypanosoma cruzi]|uniref:Uncharacterized protein n=1 Tax=Trypanosoma cruzi (strain CL Brener) TaxID=353153 RepID=Q4CMX9_TRYCC|nr:hypothetical protein Tc00.1047053507717.20 [Trypanosoma cruzi]EAN81631.1 hypothetical protein Tc00.1047053507717.20 [Trypanosoma cruzi]RNC45708.1 putative E3 ubiquitin-protein ligase HECTD1-like isoform X6 [Trypanosoma cruzi]|eukprot:XP_803077.1 hypothetical protein [Trypanosoma cruzi strain CL Brener]